EASGGARNSVRLSELFERLLRFRNREVGHGAAGQRQDQFYDRLGQALLNGVPEVLGKLDVLAGARLVYVEDVRRLPSGRWHVERSDLTGETVRRILPLE